MLEFFKRRGRKEEASEEIALPGLQAVRDPAPGAWLVESMVTFAATVASFLPGQFEAYVRIDGPVDQLGDRPHTGRLSRKQIEALLPHLAAGTSAADRCYFAVWNGYGVPERILFYHGDGPAPVMPPRKPRHFHAASLHLPARDYHVYRGPLEAALTDFVWKGPEIGDLFNQSANLWWPEDHAWCVATEIDLPWTYVGGSRSLIEAIMREPTLRCTQTTASSTR